MSLSLKDSLNANLITPQYLIDNTGDTVIIGDSYTEGYSADGMTTPWYTYVKTACNLKNVVVSCKGGASFTTTDNTFLILLNKCSNSSTVKNVIVVGGYNEYSDETTTYAAIETFCSTVASKFPNAKIFLGMVAFSTKSADWDRLSRVAAMYQNAGKLSCDNICYLNNVQYSIHTDSCMATDAYHPNNVGQQMIGKYVAQALKTGSCLPQYWDKVAKITWANFKLVNTTWQIDTVYDGNKSRIIWGDTVIAPTSGSIVCNGTAYKICSITETNFIGDSNGYTCYDTSVIIGAGSAFYTVNCQFRISGRDIYMAFYAVNDGRNNYLTLTSVSQIQIHRGSMVW